MIPVPWAQGTGPDFAAITMEGYLVRRLPVLSGLVLTVLMAIAPGAEARRAVQCNRTVKSVTVKSDLIVPAGGACRLVRVTVRGDIQVRAGGFLQATHTTVRGSAEGRRAQTLFFDGRSRVTGNVVGDRTGQVFVFASTVEGRIDVRQAAGKVNICGNTVRGDIHIAKRSGPDILVGDPLAIDCPGNRVTRGDILLEDNATDVELVVRGNTLKRGDLQLRRNGGPSAKAVQDNTGTGRLVCLGNAAPFTVSGNSGWASSLGQCA
jgi:hypothetical protein